MVNSGYLPAIGISYVDQIVAGCKSNIIYSSSAIKPERVRFIRQSEIKNGKHFIIIAVIKLYKDRAFQVRLHQSVTKEIIFSSITQIQSIISQLIPYYNIG